MRYESIGFMGGGRITRIILGGMQRAGKFPHKVVVSDTNADALDRLTREFPRIISAGADNSGPAACDLVLVSLHPPVLIEALQKDELPVLPDHLCLVDAQFPGFLLGDFLFHIY